MALQITSKTTKDELEAEVRRLQEIEGEFAKVKTELAVANGALKTVTSERDDIADDLEGAHKQLAKAGGSSKRLDLELGPIGATEVQRRGWQVSEEGFVYKFVGSCKSDLGYNVDSLKGRAVYAANDAFSLDKLGVDKGGNAAWEGWPAFSVNREIIITVEVR